MTETVTTTIIVEADDQLDAMLEGSQILFEGGEKLDDYVVETDSIGDPTYSCEEL